MKIKQAKMIITYNNTYLFLQRAPTSNFNKLKWEFPGGKIENNESFEKGILREVKEETKLNITLLGEVSRIENNERTAITYFGISEDDNVIISSEHIKYKWMNQNEIKTFNGFINKELTVDLIKKSIKLFK